MKICIYCSSSDALKPEYYELARKTAQILAQRGHVLVYGGARVGIMGVLANEMLSHHAQVIGIIPKVIEAKEIAHKGISELHITETMQQRKQMLQDISDAFLVLPGGFGTLEELFETLTAKQLEFYDKPLVILNSFNFYSPLLEQFEHFFQENITRKDYANLYHICQSPEDSVAFIESYKQANIQSKWYKDNLNL
jgi:uncharacterized protein (TIGR00730 family)